MPIATAITLERVHDPKTHRIDALAVAKLYGLSVTQFARTIGESRETIKSRPASPKLQPKLKALVVAYDGLGTVFPEETIPKWLNHPARRLGGLSPLQFLEQHGLDSFQALVDEVLEGVYA